MTINELIDLNPRARIAGRTSCSSEDGIEAVGKILDIVDGPGSAQIAVQLVFSPALGGNSTVPSVMCRHPSGEEVGDGLVKVFLEPSFGRNCKDCAAGD